MIRINKLRQQVHIGITDEEREAPQRIDFDLEIYLKSKEAYRSDKISDTVDYALVCEKISELIAASKWNLLEKLTADIAGMLMSDFSEIARVVVSADKFVIPETESVSVEFDSANC